MSEAFSRINWVDFFSLIIFIRISYVSSRAGVGKQVLPSILLVAMLAVILHSYMEIASLFINNYSFNPSTCIFVSYISIMLVLWVVYKLVSRVTGTILSVGETSINGIEIAGGTFVGMFRSLIIVGILVIGLLLTPVKFIEDAVRRSYSGSFVIGINLKIYTVMAKLIFRDQSVAEENVKKQLFAAKSKYFLEGVNIKSKAKFFKEK